MNDSHFNDKRSPRESLFNGYYLTLAELRKDAPPEDFYFLSEIYEGTEVSALHFLHGYCYTFAIELSKKFGYEIETVKDEDLDLIHAYCVAEVGGEHVYIDIRGITNDPALFFDDFGDLVPVDNGKISEFYLDRGWLSMDVYPSAEHYLNDYPRYRNCERASDARRFIDAYPHLYDVEYFMHLSLKQALDHVISQAESKKDMFIRSKTGALPSVWKDIGKEL